MQVNRSTFILISLVSPFLWAFSDTSVSDTLFLLRSYLPVAVIAYFVIIHRPEDEIVGLLALVPFALIVVVAFIHVAVVVNTDLFLDLFLILLIGSLHFTICVGYLRLLQSNQIHANTATARIATASTSILQRLLEDATDQPTPETKHKR